MLGRHWKDLESQLEEQTPLLEQRVAPLLEQRVAPLFVRQAEEGCEPERRELVVVATVEEIEWERLELEQSGPPLLVWEADS